VRYSWLLECRELATSGSTPIEQALFEAITSNCRSEECRMPEVKKWRELARRQLVICVLSSTGHCPVLTQPTLSPRLVFLYGSNATGHSLLGRGGTEPRELAGGSLFDESGRRVVRVRTGAFVYRKTTVVS
jgi:hypothetical protein